MRSALGLSKTNALAVAICSTALTGCPQLLQDDFKVVAVEANAGASSTGGSWSFDHSSASSSGNIDAGAGGLFGDVGGAGGSTSGGAGSNVSDMGGIAAVGGAANTGGASDMGGSRCTGGASEMGGTSNTGGASDMGGTSNTGGASDTGGASNTGGASSAGELCTSGQFANIELITGLNVSGQLWGPTLSADALTLFFEMYAASATHVYVATRTHRGAAFSPAVVVPVQGANTIQAAPFLGLNGLDLYFAAAAQSSSNDRDIWFASRADSSIASFSNAAALREVNTTSYENRPWVSDDELTLLFVSNRPDGAGDFDIWSATRPSRNQAFSPPTNLTTINTTYRDESPVMSNDRLTLYFTSTRRGGLGKHDIWTATRSNGQGLFSSPTALKVLNSPSEEWDPALSHDEAELFFASDLSGTPQLWRATRDCVATGL